MPASRQSTKEDRPSADKVPAARNVPAASRGRDTSAAITAAMAQSAPSPSQGGIRSRRESRPITSIATTTTTTTAAAAAAAGNTPTPPLLSNPRSGGGGGGNPSPGQANLTTPPIVVPTEDTTFSLPIDIIHTPDLDELCLSPVGSVPESRSPSPLASTPVILEV
jgi:hypothetical protein